MTTAILVTGLPRCIGFNEYFFEKLCLDFDVFIVTNKTSIDITKPFKNAKKTFFIDDNPYLKKQEEFLLSLKEGSKILQWQKLKVGKFLIEKQERKEKKTYEKIIKLRTDLNFNEEINIDMCNKNTLHMRTDYYFYSQRETFFKACDFFDHIFDYYNNFDYLPIDEPSVISKCDLECARFEWLNYPLESSLSRVPYHEANLELIKDTFYKHSIGETNSFNYRKNHNSINFPSEPAFLHYLLSNGIAVKSIKNFKFDLLKNRKQKSKNILDNIYNEKFIDSLDVNKNELDQLDANYFVNLSNSHKTNDIIKAKNLMKIAHKIRPNGPYIQKKLTELNGLIKNEKNHNRS